MAPPRVDSPKCPECAWATPLPSRSEDDVAKASALLEQHLLTVHALRPADARQRVQRWAAMASEEITQVE